MGRAVTKRVQHLFTKMEALSDIVNPTVKTALDSLTQRVNLTEGTPHPLDHAATVELFSYETEFLKLIYYTKDHEYLVPHLARCFENSLAFHRNVLSAPAALSVATRCTNSL